MVDGKQVADGVDFYVAASPARPFRRRPRKLGHWKTLAAMPAHFLASRLRHLHRTRRWNTRAWRDRASAQPIGTSRDAWAVARRQGLSGHRPAVVAASAAGGATSHRPRTRIRHPGNDDLPVTQDHDQRARQAGGGGELDRRRLPRTCRTAACCGSTSTT